jgi:hypothetical protein
VFDPRDKTLDLAVWLRDKHISYMVESLGFNTPTAELMATLTVNDYTHRHPDATIFRQVQYVVR